MENRVEQAVVERRVKDALEAKDPAELPIIDGHRLEPHELGAFEAYCELGNIAAVARKTGIPRRTLYDWTHLPWWKTLCGRYLGRGQRELLVRMGNRVDEIESGYFAVMGGHEDYQKIGSAVMQGVRTFLESGPEAQITKRGPDITINNNTQVNHLTLSPERLAELPTDKVLEMAATGEIPEDL